MKEASASASAVDTRKIFQVSELARLIKAALENEFGNVWIEGELSNVLYHGSGHIYFTVKDAEAQIQGAMFRGSQRSLHFRLKDGLKVRIFGEITSYAPRSQYQIIARQVEEAGKGSLQEQFEALKKKLAAEGLFAPERKKKLPLLPQHIGIVTSPTGAAIRDILNILGRRFPNLHVLIAPVRVQGEGAAQEIAAAIDLLNARGGLDVLIVGRGGGSLEDLWCFNEEVVARAIARSRLPVISAVGHEIDFTISDFVADLRAPTPSAAAELVIGNKEDFETQLRQHSARFAGALKVQLLELRNRLDMFRTSMAGELRSAAQQRSQQVDELGLRMQHQFDLWRTTCRQTLQDANPRMARALRGATQRTALHTQELLLRLGHGMTTARNAAAQDLRRVAAQLNALNPLAILERGFSLTRLAGGAIIRDAADAPAGTKIETRLARGSLEANVTVSKKET